MKMKCPFTRKDCMEAECALFRVGMRYYDDGRPPEEVRVCVFNLMVDCLENIIMRMIGQQKATEQTRNGIHNLNEFFNNLIKLKAIEDRNG